MSTLSLNEYELKVDMRIPIVSLEGEQPLAEAVNLKKYFPVRSLIFTRGYVRAVDDVSFSIPKDKTLSFVGESGSGKTTTKTYRAHGRQHIFRWEGYIETLRGRSLRLLGGALR